MPYKPPHRCNHPGCPERITEGAYCLKHKRTRLKVLDQNRPNSYRRGYTKRWAKIRAIQLAKHPTCKDCERDNRITVASEVHHIVPISKGGTHAPSNLMSLCKSCHSKRTGREKARGE